MNSITEYYTFGVKVRQFIFLQPYDHALLFPTTRKPLLHVVTILFPPTLRDFH